MTATITPPIQGVQLSAMQFLEHPNARALREHGGGAHGFLCLHGYPILASNRDPTMYEYGTRPTTDKEVYVSIHSGGHTVGPALYMETIAALQPDLYVALCDEVTADARPKRVAASTKRTTAWLDVCLQLHEHYSAPQEGEQQRPGGGGGGPLAGSLLLAPLAGGAVPAERARAAAAVADKPGVQGYALCGLGAGEAPEQRPQLIAASLGAVQPHLYDTRPVFVSGLAASPEELLEAVAEGVDLLDCSYVAQVTAGGYALSFPLRPPPGWEQLATGAADGDAVECSALREEVEALAEGMEPVPGGRRAASTSGQSSPLPAVGPDVTAGADDTKINLWSTAHRLDKAPLLPGCGCFACRRHSRAYVHHLLNTHEMLAEVLLEAHNTSHMQAFCQAVREAIAEGRLEQFRAWFRSLRAAPLVAPSRPPGGKRRALGQEAAAAGGGEEASEEEGGVGARGGAQSGRDVGRAKWVRV